MSDIRPNPDELLIKVEQSEKEKKRGKLKIFFGACAGVGKTFSMLQAAQMLHSKGKDVVVGIIETHGRPETAALLLGLEILPLKIIKHENREFKELDLDAALARKPELILIDELAHTNFKNSRHSKRWQDVEELLEAGIDVYTTVNVQHLESLNDIVGHITGIQVHETFPDRIFDQVDDIVLVDLPPDDLIDRLKSGKVYIPDQIKHAIQNFFRKGNLIALRELALRRMADRVDVQMREYRLEQAITHVWQTKERILVCIGPQNSSRHLVRKAYRLANSLRADWLAIYVETPQLQKLSESSRNRILKNLKLAQELGAETHVLSGAKISELVVSYARSCNVSKIIVGKPERSRIARLLRSTLAEDLINHMADIDIYIVKTDLEEREEEAGLLEKHTYLSQLEFESIPKSRWRNYVCSVLILGMTTLFASVIAYYSNFLNAGFIFLLGNVIVASFYGKYPAILTSLLTVILFYFLISFSRIFLSLEHSLLWSSLLVMAVVTLSIVYLITNINYQAKIANYRERRTHAVFSLSKELAASLTLMQIVEITTRHFNSIFQCKAYLFLPDSHQKMIGITEEAKKNGDFALAQWVFDHEQPAGFGTQTLPASTMLYIPLKALVNVRGVIGLLPKHPQEIYLPEQQRLLDSFVSQIALALEHIHYIEVARDALLVMESERLRNKLMGMISNRLHVPFLEILESSEILLKDPTLTVEMREKIALLIYEKALYINTLMSKIGGKI